MGKKKNVESEDQKNENQSHQEPMRKGSKLFEKKQSSDPRCIPVEQSDSENSLEEVEPAIRTMKFREKRGTRMKDLMEGKFKHDNFWSFNDKYFGGSLGFPESDDPSDNEYVQSSSGRDEFDSDFGDQDSCEYKRTKKKKKTNKNNSKKKSEKQSGEKLKSERASGEMEKKIDQKQQKKVSEFHTDKETKKLQTRKHSQQLLSVKRGKQQNGQKFNSENKSKNYGNSKEGQKEERSKEKPIKNQNTNKKHFSPKIFDFEQAHNSSSKKPKNIKQALQQANEQARVAQYQKRRQQAKQLQKKLKRERLEKKRQKKRIQDEQFESQLVKKINKMSYYHKKKEHIPKKVTRSDFKTTKLEKIEQLSEFKPSNKV